MNVAAHTRIRALNERGALQAALLAERANPVSSRTFGCGCTHTYAGPLGALVSAGRCAGHSPVVPEPAATRTFADDEREMAEIVAWMRASARTGCYHVAAGEPAATGDGRCLDCANPASSGPSTPDPATLARINMDDANSNDLCDACGHRFGYAKAKIVNGQLVHRDLDCTQPGVWS
jgi:hypothetical protein